MITQSRPFDTVQLKVRSSASGVGRAAATAKSVFRSIYKHAGSQRLSLASTACLIASIVFDFGQVVSAICVIGLLGSFVLDSLLDKLNKIQQNQEVLIAKQQSLSRKINRPGYGRRRREPKTVTPDGEEVTD